MPACMNENGEAGRRKDVLSMRLTKVGNVLKAGVEPAPGAAVEKAGQVNWP